MSSTPVALCLGHLGQGTSGQGQPRDPGGDHEQTGGSTRGSTVESHGIRLRSSKSGQGDLFSQTCFDRVCPDS